MSQELSYKHPDGWVITTQNFSEGQTEINSPTKTEPSGWVNVPNVDPYQGLVKVEQLDVNSLSAITANMGSITSGTITMDADGYIKGGQTAYNTGTGFFLGYDGSAYKFSIGGATNNLKWDGTDMIINGSTVNAVNFELNGTGVTANANELNLLDGVTSLNPIVWIQATRKTNNAVGAGGSYFYTCMNTGTLYRYRKIGSALVSDSGGDNTFWLDSATYNPIAEQGGIAYISPYIYTWGNNGGTYYLLRIDTSTKAITEMTISGTAPDNDAGNVVISDGTNIYIGDYGTTTLRKYTISGTTATFSTAITMPDLLTGALTTNGTNIWFETSNTGNTHDLTLYKTNMSGVEQSRRKLNELVATAISMFIFENIVYHHFYATVVDAASANASVFYPVDYT